MKVEVCILFDPEILFPGIYSKETIRLSIYINVHCRIAYNNEEFETICLYVDYYPAC